MGFPLRRLRLGVNVDHVATLREARKVDYPDPVEAARLAEGAGAEGITVHLREDRRHIRDDDVERLRQSVRSKLNLEMAATPEMIDKALAVRPEDVCLVPERRQELTTEGGLDVVDHEGVLREAVERLQRTGVRVSLFIDPDREALEASARIRAKCVELHTGTYCNSTGDQAEAELERLRVAARCGADLGLQVNGGHGLHVSNVAPVARISELEELNIGHSIVARAVLIGMEAAVREMRRCLDEARERRHERP